MSLIQFDKPVIYTALFGNYDEAPPPPPTYLMHDYYFLLFTDKDIDESGWRVFVIDSIDPLRSNRHCKMYPWLYFKTTCSFYIDSHVRVGQNFGNLALRLITGNSNFSVFKHRQGGDIASEFVRCIDNRKIGRKQISDILKQNIAFSKTAVECGFIYRDHTFSLLEKHSAIWWDFFVRVCQRDQLFVIKAADMAAIKIDILDCCFNDGNNYLSVGKHKYSIFKNIVSRLQYSKNIILSGLILNE